MIERRSCARWRVSGLVFVKKGEEEIRGYCCDISFKGLSALLPQSLEENSIWEITVSFPQRKPIKTVCLLVWQKKTEKGLRAGFSFLKILDTDKEEIFEYALKSDLTEVTSYWWRGL